MFIRKIMVLEGLFSSRKHNRGRALQVEFFHNLNRTQEEVSSITEEIPRWVKRARRDIKQLAEFVNSYMAMFAASSKYIHFAIRTQLISASRK